MEHRLHGTDTGSPEVQVAIFSDRIKRLTEHLRVTWWLTALKNSSSFATT